MSLFILSWGSLLACIGAVDLAAELVSSAGCGYVLPRRVPKGHLSPPQFIVVQDPNHPGGKRNYRLFVPTSYNPSTPTPLVLDFHGFYDTAVSEAKEDGLTMAAEQEGFIVAYPNGLADKPGDYGDWNNQWNGGGMNGSVSGKYGKHTCYKGHSKYPCYESCIIAGVCKRGKRQDCGCSGCADDKGFVVALLEKLKTELCLDTSRVHATAISMGAIFLYYLATTHEVGSQLASIVPVEGSFLLGFLDVPAVSMPVMDIHGKKDNCVPANVSNSWGKFKRQGCPLEAAGKQGCAIGDDFWLYHPMPDILKTWSVKNQCPPTAQAQAIKTPQDGNTGWSCMLPYGDKCKAEVQFCTHNLGHTWPFHVGVQSASPSYGRVPFLDRVRTKLFGEVAWSFMKDKRRVPPPPATGDRGDFLRVLIL